MARDYYDDRLGRVHPLADTPAVDEGRSGLPHPSLPASTVVNPVTGRVMTTAEFFGSPQGVRVVPCREGECPGEWGHVHMEEFTLQCMACGRHVPESEYSYVWHLCTNCRHG